MLCGTWCRHRYTKHQQAMYSSTFTGALCSAIIIMLVIQHMTEGHNMSFAPSPAA
jgi:hypothetical protein